MNSAVGAALTAAVVALVVAVVGRVSGLSAEGEARVACTLAAAVPPRPLLMPAHSPIQPRTFGTLVLTAHNTAMPRRKARTKW